MTQSAALLTDMYQITMAYGYWKTGIHNHDAIFHHFYRTPPFKHPYLLYSGLYEIIQFLKHLKFSNDDLDYLSQLKGNDGALLFEDAFLHFLGESTFQCSVDAMPEGSVVFPHQPMMRIQGPLWQAQIIETALLNQANFASLIATKASRIVHAAQGDTVLEFGLRRAQGPNGGITASRAAYIGGCHATSNLKAGMLYDIPVKGTHAHSWVMCYENERSSFESYALAMPNNCIFLVDTYDTIQGVKNAIETGKKLRKKGADLLGIRLDSGNLKELSIAARNLLNAEGFEKTAIVASNDLDEYQIQELKDAGAKISIWGVGTRLSTAYDQPALGGVYKLAGLKVPANHWTYKIKLSEQALKISNPGCLNVKRFYDQQGVPVGDILFNEHHDSLSNEYVDLSNHSKDLMIPIFRKGKLVYKSPTTKEIRAYCLGQQALFSKVNWSNYYTGLSDELTILKQNLIQSAKPS